MRKIITLVLIAALLCGCLAACGEENKEKIGICVPEGSILDTAALTKEFENKGYAVNVFSEANAESLFEESYKLLIVEPVTSAWALEVLNAPKRNGTPVLFVDYCGEPPEKAENASFLYVDHGSLASVQAQAISGLPQGGDINGDGTVAYAILAGTQHEDANAEQLESISNGLSGATLLELRNCDGTPEAARSVCAGFLSTYGRDLEVLICVDRGLTEAVVATVADNGRVPGRDLYVIGAGNTATLTQNLNDGALNATVASDAAEVTKLILKVADAMLNGGEYETGYSLPCKTLKK